MDGDGDENVAQRLHSHLDIHAFNNSGGKRKRRWRRMGGRGGWEEGEQRDGGAERVQPVV